MCGSRVVIEVYSADLGTHCLYSKNRIKSSNLFEDFNTVCVGIGALVLLLNTNERFQDRNRNVLCSLRNPSLVFENHIISNVTEYLHPVPFSIQSIFYNSRNKTFVSLLHSKSKSLCIQKDCKANSRNKTLFSHSTS